VAMLFEVAIMFRVQPLRKMAFPTHLDFVFENNSIGTRMVLIFPLCEHVKNVFPWLRWPHSYLSES